MEHVIFLGSVCPFVYNAFGLLVLSLNFGETWIFTVSGLIALLGSMYSGG